MNRRALFAFDVGALARIMSMFFTFITAFEGVRSSVTDPEGPLFIREPPTRVDFANSTGTRVECAARGSPPPVIRWTRLDGNPASDIPHLRRVFSNGTMIFLPFRAEEYRADVHSVTYVCRASNPSGSIISRETRVRAVVLQLYEVQVYDEYVIRGNTAVMRCHIPSFVKDYVTVVSWVEETDGSSNSIETGGRYLITASGELHVSQVNTSDNANAYRCRTKHQLTGEVRLSAVSPSGRLYVTEPRGSVPPRITDHRSTVHAVQGESVLLPCAGQGFPVPTYSWFAKMNEIEVLPISASIRIRQMGGTLLLTNALILDAGTYVCEVSNSMGSVRIETSLFVSAPLSAYIYPPRQVVDVGQSATLTCVIAGYPFTQVTWLKDGKTLLTDTINHVTQEVLQLDNVHRRDRGMYQCFVNNYLEVVQGTAELALGDTFPEFQRVFSDKIVLQGSFVTLECVVSGSPMPKIVWTLDDVRIYDDDDKRFGISEYVDGNSDVIGMVNISRVRVEDGGEYACVATNHAGSVQHVAKLSVQGPPFIRLHETVTAVAGTDLVVRCYVTGYPIDSVHWERDQRVLPVNLRQKVFNNGTLLVQNVQKALDEGRYTCVARAGIVSERRDTNVSVMAPPKIIPFSFQDEHLREGARARIQCVVSEGDLPIAITWIKDGRVVLNDEWGIVIRDLDDFSSMLTVNSVSSQHNGNYTCLATNKAAPTNYTTELLVNVPPKILPFSFRDAQLQEGMRAQITCSISEGDEPVRMSWLKDGQPLTPTLGVSVREFDRHTSSLSIERVASDHGGNYTCTATNRAAHVRHTALLLVNVPPRWLTQPTDADTLLNANIVISCQADGFPKPTVTWMKAVGDSPGDYRDISFGLSHIYLHDDGSLELTNARESDKGYYLCKASNGIGAGLSEVIYVSVHVPAYFQTNSRNVTVKVGGQAELVCEAYGDKPLTVAWTAFRDAARVEAASRYKVNDNYWEKGTLSELVIEDVRREDGGDYPCVATNAYGNDEARIRLTVQEPPERPFDLRITDVTGRNCHLSWSPPFDGHAPISLYIIQFKEHSKSWQEDSRNLTVSGYTTTYQLDRLQPATGYHARVYAKNEIGTSKASVQVDVVTEMEAPGGPPQQIRVEAVDSTSLTVFWKPPRNDLWYGRITGYKIGYRQHENEKKEFEFRAVQIEESNDVAKEMSYRLDRMKKYTKYSVIMVAFNHLGDGPPSEEVLARTAEDVPSRSPEDVQCVPISSQGLSISWEPPPTLYIHGQLQGYKVLYKPVGTWFDDSPAEVKISQTWKTMLHGLEKYQRYVIFVLAFTRVGDGVRSDPVFCLTKEDVPDAPEALKALVASVDSIIVVWRLPSRCNGVIVRFTIYMRSFDAGKDETNKFIITNNHTLSYETRNLRKNHRYEYWVTASTSIGEGQSTKPVSQTPSTRVPARILAFDEIVRYRWQENVTLNCQSVGVPPPLTDWKLHGNPLRTLERFQVLSSGSLFIARLLSSDAGLYTCRVQNIHGSDAVAYTLIVEGPPEAPQMTILSSSFTSIDVQWETPSDGGSPIEGYIIYLKRDFGEWEFVQIQFRRERHTLEALWCGTRYQIYMVAWNKIGSGEASETKSIRTRGSAPEMPPKNKLVHENSTFLALNLDSWENGGCPILYFVIEYRPADQQEWMLVSNNVKVQKEKFLILDLESRTKYALRVTAHNSAGSTVSEYDFVTRASGEIDFVDSSDEEISSPFYLDMNVAFSLTALLILLLAAFFSVIFWRKHKVQTSSNNSEGTSSEAKQYEARYIAVGGEKKTSIIQSDFDKGSFTCLLVNSEGVSDATPTNTPRNPKRVAPREEIQPYATYQLPGCKTDGFTAEDWKKYEVYNPIQQTVRALQVGCGSVYPQLRRERGECTHGQDSSLSDDQEYASPVRSSDTSDSTSGNNHQPEPPDVGLRLTRHPPKTRKPGKRAKVPDLIYRRHGECTRPRSPMSPVMFPADIGGGHTVLKIPRPQLERPSAPAPEATIETTFSFLDKMGSSQESSEKKDQDDGRNNSTNSST